MSDKNGENPKSGAGVGGTDPAIGIGTQDAARRDRPTPPHMGEASSGGELNSPNPSSGEEDFGDTRADGSPIGRELATSKNSVSEEDPAERA